MLLPPIPYYPLFSIHFFCIHCVFTPVWLSALTLRANLQWSALVPTTNWQLSQRVSKLISSAKLLEPSHQIPSQWQNQKDDCLWIRGISQSWSPVASVICDWGLGIEVHGSWSHAFQKPWAAWAMEEHIYCTHSQKPSFRIVSLQHDWIFAFHPHPAQPSSLLFIPSHRSADRLPPLLLHLLAFPFSAIRVLRLPIPSFY